MNNYHYIIGSLPELFNQWTLGDTSTKALVHGIWELCSEKDRNVVDFLVEGLKGTDLSAGFYSKAAESPSRFIREYFCFDLFVRNAKVRYLNQTLKREEGKDVVTVEALSGKDFESESQLTEILTLNDILEKERALDRLYWEKIEDITVFEYFSLDAILAFIAKLKIIDRWHKLDEESGRQLFRKLVNQVTETYTK